MILWKLENGNVRSNHFIFCLSCFELSMKLVTMVADHLQNHHHHHFCHDGYIPNHKNHTNIILYVSSIAFAGTIRNAVPFLHIFIGSASLLNFGTDDVIPKLIKYYSFNFVNWCMMIVWIFKVSYMSYIISQVSAVRWFTVQFFFTCPLI